eukprot:1112257-Lingulodinium_polyedra.AAC.1
MPGIQVCRRAIDVASRSGRSAWLAPASGCLALAHFPFRLHRLRASVVASFAERPVWATASATCRS